MCLCVHMILCVCVCRLYLCEFVSVFDYCYHVFMRVSMVVFMYVWICGYVFMSTYEYIFCIYVHVYYDYAFMFVCVVMCLYIFLCVYVFLFLSVCECVSPNLPFHKSDFLYIDFIINIFCC